MKAHIGVDAQSGLVHVVKNLFGHRKARYNGLAKNERQLFTLFGLANLGIAKRSLLKMKARGAS